MADIARLDPANRAAVERLLRLRPLRLAALNSPAHRSMWPRTFAQLPAVTEAMRQELTGELGAAHPHVRWLGKVD